MTAAPDAARKICTPRRRKITFLKASFALLCLKISMAAKAPGMPPAKERKKSHFSGTLRHCFTAHSLSVP